MNFEPNSPGTVPPASPSVPYVTAAQATALLRSGLAIASELISASIPAVLRAVLDNLNTRWDLDAEGQFVRRLLHDRSSELRAEMLLKLRARQDSALNGLFKRVEAARPATLTAETLSLLDPVSINSTTIVNRYASRMHGVVEEPFRDLHLIVQHLCGRPTLRPAEDPFAPDVFLQALLDGAIELSLNQEGWDLFASSCERPLADEVNVIHRSLLDHFQRHGLDAMAIRREAQARQHAERLAAKQAAERAVMEAQARLQRATQFSNEAGGESRPQYGSVSGLDLNVPGGFTGGYQGPSPYPGSYPGQGGGYPGPGGGHPGPGGGHPGQGGGYPQGGGYAGAGGGPAGYGSGMLGGREAGGYAPAGAGRHGPPIDAPQAPAGYVLGQLMSRMQASVTGMPAPGGFAPSSPAGDGLLSAVGELQQLGLEGLAGASISGSQPGTISAWREHLVQKSSRTVDKLTIEIVGLMFDHVLQDPQVPAEIKTLLSRLQFPVLKAALIDADFFASNGHPARRLIDRMATASVGWEPYGDENDRFRGEIERVVKEVLHHFDKDVAVFERLLGEFETFLGDIGPRDSDPVARAKRALEEAEKREILVINTTIQVRRAFEKVELDPVLRDFLIGPWVQTLVEASMRDAATPGFSKRFREAIHDLVWSVQPKANSEDRKRLTVLIPNLIRVLRDGMALTRTPEHDQQTFLKHLMQAHAVAVKPVDQATYIRSSLITSEIRAKVEGLQITGTHPISTVAGGFRVSNGAVMRAAEQFAADVHMPGPVTDIGNLDRVEEAKMDEEIASWQRGTWFEMRHDEEVIKVRLRWISPLRTLFLFSANQEKDAHVLPPDVIKSYMKRGYLKVLESTPLTKRAVDHVMGDFEKMPQFAQELVSRYAPA